MKVAINKCYGGFSVSKAVYDELSMKWDGYGQLDNESLGIEGDDYAAWRTNDKLIAAIEKVGIENASGSLAEIKIVEIPDNIAWYIEDYDGIETIHEAHNSW